MLLGTSANTSGAPGFDRFGWLEHCGQRFDVKRDGLGRIFRLRHGFRDHAGNRITHETYIVTASAAVAYSGSAIRHDSLKADRI